MLKIRLKFMGFAPLGQVNKKYQNFFISIFKLACFGFLVYILLNSYSYCYIFDIFGRKWHGKTNDIKQWD